MKKWLLILSITCLFSCNSNVDTIDISHIEKVNIEIAANDVYRSINFVPLETKSECLLSNPSVFAINDSSVFIWDKDDVYRFSSSGKFRNRVGSYGKGYGEHGHINSVNYDRKRDALLLGSFDGAVYKYKSNGDFIGKSSLTFQKELLQTVRWNDAMDCMVCEIREYSEKGLNVHLQLVSFEGEKLKTFEIYSDNHNIPLNMLKSGMLRNSNEGVYFKLPFDNRLFFLSNNGLSVPLIFEQGDAAPSRRDIEDMEYSAKTRLVKQRINNIVITNENLYLSIEKAGKDYDVLINRDDNTIIHCSRIDRNKQIHLSLSDMKSFSFWPWVEHSGKCMDLISVEDISPEDLKKMGYEEIDINKPNMELNPILVIACERK